MVTYYGSEHFCASIRIQGQWWLYDGLIRLITSHLLE